MTVKCIPINFVTLQSYIKNSILGKTQMVYIQEVGISHFVNYFIRLIYFNYFLWPPSLGDLKTGKGKLKLFSL